MDEFKKFVTEVGMMGVWIPPLAATQARLNSFKDQISKKGTQEFKGWKSYKSSLSNITSLGKIPEPSADFITAISVPAQYKKSKDEFARLQLSSNRLLKKIQTQWNPSAPTQIEVLINNVRMHSAEPKQGAKPTAVDQNHTYEILSQKLAADIFVLNTIQLNTSAERGISIAWDMLLPILADVVYSVKSLAQKNRPTEVNAINLDDVLIEVPEHSSWPGGHAFGAAALATLIYFCSKSQDKDLLGKAATRIAKNREYAGLHWEEDSISGLEFGIMVMAGILEHIAAKEPAGELMQFCRYSYNA